MTPQELTTLARRAGARFYTIKRIYGYQRWYLWGYDFYESNEPVEDGQLQEVAHYLQDLGSFTALRRLCPLANVGKKDPDYQRGTIAVSSLLPVDQLPANHCHENIEVMRG